MTDQIFTILKWLLGGSGLFSIIVSVFSLIFYGIDAVFSVVRAIRKDNTTLNIIIVALFVVCLILGVWVISSYLRNYKTIVWFISYFSLFIIELISIIRCFVRKNQKTETSSIIWCHLKRSPTTNAKGRNSVLFCVWLGHSCFAHRSARSRSFAAPPRCHSWA